MLSCIGVVTIGSAIARTKADNQKFWWVADFAAFDR